MIQHEKIDHTGETIRYEIVDDEKREGMLKMVASKKSEDFSKKRTTLFGKSNQELLRGLKK